MAVGSATQSARSKAFIVLLCAELISDAGDEKKKGVQGGKGGFRKNMGCHYFDR